MVGRAGGSGRETKKGMTTRGGDGTIGGSDLKRRKRDVRGRQRRRRWVNAKIEKGLLKGGRREREEGREGE